ncbi:MAG: carbohydrate kinase [Bacteroidota bacterium]
MQKKVFQNIICFGEVLWDMLPTGAKPGGAPLNVAIHLKKQGQDPILISRIGNDEEGEKLLQFLTESEIDTQFIQKDKELSTSKVLVHLDENRNATYEICEPVAWDNILYQSEVKEVTQNADLFIFGSLASRNYATLNTLFQILENSKAQRLMDVNLRPPYNKKEVVEKLLFLSDVVKLNDDELGEIADWHNKSGNENELIDWFAGYYNCTTLCVTRGANGAALLVGNKLYEHPGFKVDAVDTVGSGDSFLASLVANLSKNSSPKKALEQACATGAFVASQNGAVPGYSEKEIQNIIKREP